MLLENERTELTKTETTRLVGNVAPSDERSVTIKGQKGENSSNRKFLCQGIATRAFERKFNLAEHVEITGARLKDGILTIELLHELPEEMKPRKIKINVESPALEHQPQSEIAA